MKKKIVLFSIAAIAVIIVIFLFNSYRLPEQSGKRPAVSQKKLTTELFRKKLALSLRRTSSAERSAGYGFVPLLNDLADRKISSTVFELEKIKRTASGDLFMSCIFPDISRRKLKGLERGFGLNPMQDAGRFLFTDIHDYTEMSFDDSMLKDSPEIMIKKFWRGDIPFYSSSVHTGEYEGMKMFHQTDMIAVYDENIIISGSDNVLWKEVDRLQENKPSGTSGIFNDQDTINDIYGYLNPSELKSVFSKDSDVLQKFSDMVSWSKFGVTFSDDSIHMELTVNCTDSVSAFFIANAFSTLITGLKIKALFHEDPGVPEIMSTFQVEREGETVIIFSDIPLDLLNSTILPHCRDEAEPVPSEPGKPEP